MIKKVNIEEIPSINRRGETRKDIDEFLNSDMK